jgi:hypothetical protein
MSISINSNQNALDELMQAWSMLIYIRQTLNAIDGDEVPFSASALERTLAAAEDKCGAVHEYFETAAAQKAAQMAEHA